MMTCGSLFARGFKGSGCEFGVGEDRGIEAQTGVALLTPRTQMFRV